MSHLLLLVPCYFKGQFLFLGYDYREFFDFLRNRILLILAPKQLYLLLEIIQIISYKLISNVDLGNFKY